MSNMYDWAVWCCAGEEREGGAFCKCPFLISPVWFPECDLVKGREGGERGREGSERG